MQPLHTPPKSLPTPLQSAIAPLRKLTMLSIKAFVNISPIFAGFKPSTGQKSTAGTFIFMLKLNACTSTIVQNLTIEVTRSSTRKNRFGGLLYTPVRLTKTRSVVLFVTLSILGALETLPPKINPSCIIKSQMSIQGTGTQLSSSSLPSRTKYTLQSTEIGGYNTLGHILAVYMTASSPKNDQVYLHVTPIGSDVTLNVLALYLHTKRAAWIKIYALPEFIHRKNRCLSTLHRHKLSKHNHL